jgi:hypothetical protein
MKISTKLIAAASISLLPTVSYGQAYSARTASGDAAYCRALIDIYVRYIGWDELYGDRGSRKRANNDAQVAVVKCRQGDTAWAIPVLERELISNKFTLPPRG